MSERKYTWAIVTYASREEFQPLLDKARHWAYCLHDKDFVTNDTGARVPKEPHTHIIATFEQNVSLSTVRGMVDSKQNTLAQEARTDSIRGLWKYLIHEGENELEKHLYDESERICDDPEYWKRRAKDDLLQMVSQEQFYEDLLADDMSICEMGRKYGRDFIKNLDRYMNYRYKAKIERGYQERYSMLDGLINHCIELDIPVDDLYCTLYEIYSDRVSEISRNSRRRTKRDKD